jgi:hypothetical protein
MLVLTGFSIEFIGNCFYLDNSSYESAIMYNYKITFADMQMILLTTSVMYFALGSVLEYMRQPEGILLAFLGLFALGKVTLGVLMVVFHADSIANFININNVQLIHLFVVCRFGIYTIFIIGIAKWFSRY